MKNTFKKVLCLFAAALTLAAFTGCDSNSKKAAPEEDEDDEVVTSRVVYDENDIKISFVKSDDDYVISNLHIENNSDTMHCINFDDCMVNGMYIGSNSTSYLEAGESITLPIDFNIDYSACLNADGSLDNGTVDVYVDGVCVADDVSAVFAGDPVVTYTTAYTDDAVREDAYYGAYDMLEEYDVYDLY